MIMCWAHMFSNLLKHVNKISDKNDESAILNDIRSLQLSSSELIFKKASILLIKKWGKKCPEFIEYFEQQWLTEDLQLCNWYEGVSSNVPSTNNALEAFNRVIKDEITFRQREPLARFKSKMLEMVEKWSNQYNIGLKNFQTTVPIFNSDWVVAYNWVKENLPVVQKDGLYFIPGEDKKALIGSDVSRILLNQWNTFEQFKKRAFSVYVVEMIQIDNWLERSKCTCPIFFKEFKCKHIIGMALRLKFCKVPLTARQEAIGQKLKRGRIPKAKKALVRQ